MANDKTKPVAATDALTTGATSGVMAQGAKGRAAREAAHVGVLPPAKPTGWRDPNARYADADTSIDARMWRLTKEIRGS